MSRLDNFEEILKSYEGRDSESTVLFNDFFLLKRDYEALKAVLEPFLPEDLDPQQVTIDDKRIFFLHIDGLVMKTLPSDIGKLSGLCRLDVCGNMLKELPESIGLLENLTRLYLAENHLNSLPESMKNLRALKDISLNRNHFETLPELLLELPNLKIVRCCRNPVNYEKDLVWQQLKVKGVNVVY